MDEALVDKLLLRFDSQAKQIAELQRRLHSLEEGQARKPDGLRPLPVLPSLAAEAAPILTVSDKDNGELKVGDFVTLAANFRPPDEKHGCLAHGELGKVVEVSAEPDDDEPYKITAVEGRRRGKWWWYEKGQLECVKKEDTFIQPHYSISASVWDATLLLGSPEFGFAGRAVAWAGLTLNVTVQVKFAVATTALSILTLRTSFAGCLRVHCYGCPVAADRSKLRLRNGERFQELAP
eukprot:SAG31_NODE_11741_length_1002_cov_0.970100_1_plen_235_part_10